jgi:ABC-2 type transport system permease protein
VAETRTRAYLLLLRSRFAAQIAYRRSFALDLFTAGAIVLIELVEVAGVFHQVRELAGFSVNDVLVMYGLASIGFVTADLLVGQLDGLGLLVRAGTLDTLLVRPLSVLGQLITNDLALRRLGRIGVSAAVLTIALARARVDWSPARVALLVISPMAGAAIAAGLWVAVSSVLFWLVEGKEFTSAFTDGGRYLAQWPVGVFAPAVGRFFTFVVPNAFVAYLPAVAILGRTDPTGLPGWLIWCGPLAAVWVGLIAAAAWRAGLRRYVGAGG